DRVGNEVTVADACGLELNIAAIVGTGASMSHSRNTWHGTLILVGQPAEETISGAERMIAGGLFKRFPRPDVAVALHVENLLPAGKVGITPGIFDTNADSVRITIFGKGGHGGSPHTTLYLTVIAARVIFTV